MVPPCSTKYNLPNLYRSLNFLGITKQISGIVILKIYGREVRLKKKERVAIIGLLRGKESKKYKGKKGEGLMSSLYMRNKRARNTRKKSEGS